MRCLILDDEPLARQGLEKYVSQIQTLNLVGSFEHPLLADEMLRNGGVDLLFLDIQMPYLTGIDFLKGLKKPPLAILHTAYPNFALEGYQLDVIDYLVKPVPFERFYQAVNKAQEYFTLRNSRPDGQARTHDFFFIKCENRYEKIVLDQILYVEAMQNYSVVHTTGEKYMTLMSLKSFGELLPDEQFIRVQKSFIVNVSKVETLEGHQVKVAGKRVPLGRQQRDELYEKLIKKHIADKKGKADP